MVILNEKRLWLAEYAGVLHTRNDPVSPKGSVLHLADLTIRSENVNGGSIPDDEMQCDFVISNNETDSHGSIMTEQTLRNYAEDAANGVPFCLDHNEGLTQQLGRTIAATYEEDSKRVIATVSLLRDSEDTPDNMKVNEFIRRIERRYYDKCSVAFRDAIETCNICGKEIFDFHRDDPCPHIPKRAYDGVVCTYNVDKARLRHVGLVNAPSNPNAALLDTRNWSEDLRNIKQDGDVKTSNSPQTELKTLLEKDGEKYRSKLIEDAIKEGIRAEENFDEPVWRERFKSRDADEIIAQTVTWTKLGDARWGEGGRKTEGGTPNGGNSNSTGQSVQLPNYLFEW